MVLAAHMYGIVAASFDVVCLQDAWLFRVLGTVRAQHARCCIASEIAALSRVQTMCLAHHDSK